MADWPFAIAVVACLGPVFAWWAKLFRARRLRIRVMAATSALGVFSAFLLAGAWDWLVLSQPMTLEATALAFVASIGLGSTFLTWWPLLGKSLTGMGIRW